MEEVKPVRLKLEHRLLHIRVLLTILDKGWITAEEICAPVFPIFHFCVCDLFQDKFEGKSGKISARKVNLVVTVWYTLGTWYKTQSLRSGRKLTHIHTTL